MIKRITAVICAALIVCALFAACGGKTNTDTPTFDVGEDYSAKIAEPSTADTSFFKVPAEAVEIDLAAEDPSNDSVSFIYDDEGKIARCVYFIDDKMVSVNYKYTDDGISVSTYFTSILLDERTIAVSSAFDPAAGFAVADGYFVKGYTF